VPVQNLDWIYWEGDWNPSEIVRWNRVTGASQRLTADGWVDSPLGLDCAVGARLEGRSAARSSPFENPRRPVRDIPRTVWLHLAERQVLDRYRRRFWP
jgi:hypothetical protein